MRPSRSRRCVWLGVAALVLAPSLGAAQAKPAPPAQAKPAPPAPPSNQTPAQPAAPAAADAPDTSRSLFEPTSREFLIGGRFTSVDGDPARFQRYQDQRDGLLFSNFRYSFAQPDGTWDFHARAENVGYRDQEFMGSYGRIGKLSLTGSWQQIPQFYSVDTMTPYTGTGGTLVLDDATQRAIQNAQTTLSAYVPQAPAFELRERRDIGRFDLVATPKPSLDLTASFTTQKHSGELPWGASFGFSNDVEVALPYDSRANDFTIGTEWTNQRNMLRVAYTGSWFDNHRADTDLGQPAPPRRQRGRRAGTRTHVPLAVELGADHQLRRVHQAGAQDAGDRLLLLRFVEQRRAAAALHHQHDTAAVRAAPREHRGGSACALEQPEPHLAPLDRLAVQRARPQLHLRQPHARDADHGHDQLRRRALDDADRRAGPLRAQPDDFRRRRHLDETDAVRGHRSATRTTGTATTRGSSSRAARTCSACRPMPSAPRGSPSGRSTITAVAAAQGSTKRS